MNTAIRVFTFLLGVIGLVTGGASISSGLVDAAPLVDNTFRFYAGIWMAVGLGLIHAAVAYEKSEQVFGFLLRAVFVGGLARAIGLLDYPPEPRLLVAIAVEIVVPLLLLKARAHAARRSAASPLLNGKRVLVTGANGGLGRETVGVLAEEGFSHVVMATRTQAKGDAARAELLTRLPNTRTKLEVAAGFDMTNPSSIEASVEQLEAEEPFDVVFLQAGGGVFSEEVQTVSHRERDVERTVFQNVFGAHVVLSNLLRRGLLAPGARVVFAGGEGARGIPGLIAKPEFESPSALRRYLGGELGDAAPYNPFNALGVSKFVGALWVSKLSEIAEGRFTPVWFSPGFTRGTQGLSGVPAPKRVFMERVAFPIMGLLGLAQTPREGARKYADCLGGRVGRGGDLIGAPEGKALGPLVDQRPMNPGLSNPALRDEVWALFETLGGPFGAAPVPSRAR